MVVSFTKFQVQELIINKDPTLLDNFLDVSFNYMCSFSNK